VTDHRSSHELIVLYAARATTTIFQSQTIKRQLQEIHHHPCREPHIVLTLGTVNLVLCMCLQRI